MRPSTPVLVAMALSSSALVASSASALTFGADLNAYTANSSATCQSVYMPLVGYIPVTVTGPLPASCSVYNTGPLQFASTLNAAGTTIVPLQPGESGTITQVRIKTGPWPGGSPSQAAARLDILGTVSHRGGGDVACCTGTATTQSITLRPNTTLTVATNLPVSAPLNGDGSLFTGQILALTMLSPTIPFPAALIPGGGGQFYGEEIFPGVAAGQERFNPAEHVTQVNSMLLMQADLTVNQAPAPTPAAQGAGTMTAKTVKDRRNRVSLPVVCPATFTGCPVTIRLQSAPGGRVVVYGTGAATIPGGTTGSVTVTMNARGRALMQGAGTRRAIATVVTGPTGSKQTSSVRVSITK